MTFKKGDIVLVDPDSREKDNLKEVRIQLGDEYIDYDTELVVLKECTDRSRLVRVRRYDRPEHEGRSMFITRFIKKEIKSMKKTFKAGDRVRMVTEYPSPNAPKVGATGTVIGKSNSGSYGVHWDKKFKGGHDLTSGLSGLSCPTGFGWFVHDYHIEKIEDASGGTPGFIVVVQKNGKLAPATTPREYKTEEQAFAVAEQMANRHGDKFFVFQPVAVAQRPVVVKAQVTRI